MFKKIIASVCLVSLLVLSACSTSNPTSSVDPCTATNTMAVTNAAVITAAQSIVTFYAAGKVSAAVYNNTENAYNSYVALLTTATTDIVALNDNNGTLTEVQLAQMASQAAIIAASIIAWSGTSQTVHLAPSITTCTITDAQIESELAMPAWSTFGAVSAHK